MNESFLAGIFLVLILFGAIISTSRSFYNQRLAKHYGRGISRKTATTKAEWWMSWWQGMSAGLVGTIITALFFTLLLPAFQQSQAVRNRQTELVLQLGSPDNAFAVEAARQLLASKWFIEPILNGAYLYGADLHNIDLAGANLDYSIFAYADLSHANLSQPVLFEQLHGEYLSLPPRLNTTQLCGASFLEATLYQTNFRRADLRHAIFSSANGRAVNLSEADLRDAKLRDVEMQSADITAARLDYADLGGAVLTDAILQYSSLRNALMFETNLQGANLIDADLRSANMMSADLRGANLWGANLQGADIAILQSTPFPLLGETLFDTDTILPDGKAYQRESDGNLERFTNPESSDFWNPCTALDPPPWYCESQSQDLGDDAKPEGCERS